MLPANLAEVLNSFCSELNSPMSEKLRALIGSQDWDSIARLSVDPAQYSSAWDFSRDSFAVDILRKCADLETSIDRKAVAVDGFWAAERQCYQTNKRLAPLLWASQGYSLEPTEWRLFQFLERVRNRISRVLGRLPDDLDASRFGPGATFNNRGVNTTIPHKIASNPSTTDGARCLIEKWAETAWFRALATDGNQSNPVTVRGNRFTTVPKDCTKDRGIAIEPSLNVYFQLGLGAIIRRRLKRVGIDLDEGQSLHRRIACEASRWGHLATIDLSSASDTVSKNLVRLIVPEPWLSVLETLRSPTTEVEGKTVYLEKFSSMGCGFTFELETLIFWAISSEVGAPYPCRKTWVYGDDIIVPSLIATEVLAALQLCGFTPNSRKTYWDGPFRESCGGDFFEGHPVRGFFLKKFPSTPADWIAFHNGLRARLNEVFYPGFCSKVLKKIRAQVPSAIRKCVGPSRLGDLVFHSDDVIDFTMKVVDEIQLFRVYRPSFKPYSLARFGPGTQLAAALYGVPSTGPIPRSAKATYRIVWSA